MRERDSWARAMERQLARWRDARSAGMPRAGWKIGINVPEVRARLGLAHPLVGWIDGHRVYAGCVVGAYRPVELAAGLGVHWPLLRVGGQAGPPARADLVPAHLGDLVQHAAALLAGFGEGLEAGDLLLSGSYADRAVALPPRTEALADFGPLGEVGLSIG